MRFCVGRRTEMSLSVAILALVAMIGLVGFSNSANATYRPSIKIGTAVLISTDDADNYYGSGTAHTIGPGGSATPSPEIVALARALKGDPDLIYEYVRNNIENVFEYGLQKGALGASIDKSGTAFDQAVLMVELLRQAHYTASYKAGTITLSGSQFLDWTGISDATSACKMLSSGAIPALINGTTSASCAYGNGTAISTVQMSHVWVSVTIGGANYVFDPAYKPHLWKTAIPFATALVMTPGNTLIVAKSGSTPGTDSGVDWRKKFDQVDLNTTLAGYATNLQTYLSQNGLLASHMQDIVGGGVISAFVSPVGGLRQTSLPYTSVVLHTWTGNIPNQYRTTLEVNANVYDYYHGGIQTMFDETFYVDEIYGRALMIDTDIENEGPGPMVLSNTITLTLDGAVLDTFFNNPNPNYLATTRAAPGTVTLTANHPYATSANGSSPPAGDYMDTTVAKSAMYATPLTIVHGWGDTAPALLAKWSEEKASDQLLPAYKLPCIPDQGLCLETNSGGQGDFDREKLAAGYLAQFSAETHLNAQIANAVPQIHHALGLVYADTTIGAIIVSGPPIPVTSMPIVDSFNRIDIDAGISLTSKIADMTTRNAALRAIAASSAALESSVAAQMDNLPDTSSTATRFEWGNTPPGTTGSLDQLYEDPSHYGPREFLQITPSNYASAGGLILAEGAVSTSNDGKQTNGLQPELGNLEAQDWRGILTDAYTDYASNGHFTVIASQESFLGPGQRAGEIQENTDNSYYHMPTKQRGGAFVAILNDGSGNPIEIAHINVQISLDPLGFYTATKGGGGGSQPTQGTAYNPADAADVLKSGFVDRSNLLGVNLANGTVGYSSPAKLSVGNGGFPYELNADLAWNPGATPNKQVAGPTIPTAPQPGWVSNWQNRVTLSGSGLEAMGQSDVRASVNTIAAFVAMQDIYREPTDVLGREVAGVLSAAWWTHRIQANVATVTEGKSSRQFLAAAGSGWILPGSGAYAALAKSGSAVQYENVCNPTGDNASYAMSRGWDNSAISFTVTNAHGDVETFGHWLNQYKLHVIDDTACGRADGFRLNTWTFPQGMTVMVDYGNPYPQGGTSTIDRIIDVRNSIGRQINFSWDNENLIGFDNNLTGPNLRQVVLNWGVQNGVNVVNSHTDPSSNPTSFLYTPNQATSSTHRPLPYSLMDMIFTADNPNVSVPADANTDYTYDGVNQIQQIKDAVAIQIGGRAPYNFFIVDGTRGERDDPLGQPYTVVYDIYGHPWRYIDELGFETDELTDGRGRALSYTYPEGNCDAFAYDNLNDVTYLWKVDTTSLCNTGAGSGHVLRVRATWDTTWHKLATLTDARNNVTSFSYVPSGNGTSMLQTATRPTINEGTPLYSFTYDSRGKMATSVVPQTQSGSTYTTVTTSYNNDPTTENLTSTTLDSGGIAATTAYLYDQIGDYYQTTDPNGNVTTSYFDNNRRKFQDRHHDGGPNAPLIAANTAHLDPVGRDYEDDVGTVFSGTTVSTWQVVKTTVYTPTSKVQTVTDADNRTTTTEYDNADRVLTVTDPIARKTHFQYCTFGADPQCAANQVKYEFRAWQAGAACSVAGTLQQCYRRLNYFPNGEVKAIKDANVNNTAYAYDGFGRLTTTTFDDGTFEQLQLDQNANVTQRTTRAGQNLTYQYNALNWMTQKVSPFPTTVTTNWTYLLDGKIDTLADDVGTGNLIDYTYDTAGRLKQVATKIPGLSTKNTWYTLDNDGNRTQLHWQDSYAINYCYDSLNRMSVALDNESHCDSMTPLATYTYDPLSRRKTLTYGNGASVAYSYTNAGDLLTLNHNLAGGANDPHYTFQYTNAHELYTEANSDADYVWQPPANSSTSYTPNNLNQYSAVGSQTAGGTNCAGAAQGLSYDCNGNLIYDGVFTFGYDAENRMLTASKTGLAASYAYDPLGRRTRKSGTGVTNTFYLSDGADEIAEYDGTSGALTTRYIPGPAIDEPIAMVLADGTKTFFHTNHQGSVIAMSGTSAALTEGPYKYDPYGNCISGSAACGSAGEPYRFTGRRLDAETGLYYYRARMYSAALGRFLQTDPVGYDADLNLYTYVGNDPTDKTDPNGQCALIICKGGADSLGDIEGVNATYDWTGQSATSANIGTSTEEEGSPSLPMVRPTIPIVQVAAEHTKGQRPSTEEKHQKGDARRGRDRAGEKADEDKRRPPRVRPNDWKGPWPAKEDRNEQKFEQPVGPCLVAGPAGCDSSVYVVPGPASPGFQVPSLPGVPAFPEFLEPIPVP